MMGMTERKTTGRLMVLAAGALCLLAFETDPALGQSKEDQARMLEQADKNRDGDIAWAEVIEMRQSIFKRLDRNKDGYVDKGDRPKMFGSRFDKAFNSLIQFDKNSDKRISRSELVNARAPSFERGDTNKDRILSAQEIEALRKSGGN